MDACGKAAAWALSVDLFGQLSHGPGPYLERNNPYWQLTLTKLFAGAKLVGLDSTTSLGLIFAFSTGTAFSAAFVLPLSWSSRSPTSRHSRGWLQCRNKNMVMVRY